jgi:hypothetical protein
MGYKFKQLDEMPLKHLPNDAKLLLQQQFGDMIDDEAVQMYLATTFVNPTNSQTVFNKGFSIQLEQIPEMIEMLTKIYEKFSGRSTIPSIVTFADNANES